VIRLRNPRGLPSLPLADVSKNRSAGPESHGVSTYHPAYHVDRVDSCISILT
jgi:hypothetical protein